MQLIQAAHDTHLWAEIYDRNLTDVLAVESDVAQAEVDHPRVAALLAPLHPAACEAAIVEAKVLTSALLRLDPMFDKLRQDERFQALASGAARACASSR